MYDLYMSYVRQVAYSKYILACGWAKIKCVALNVKSEQGKTKFS